MKNPLEEIIIGIKHNHPIPCFFVILVIIFISSCATVPPSMDEQKIEVLVEELNTADEDRLVELSALPFLLDGETIVRDEDIRILWINVRNIGFSFAEASIEEIRSLDAASYKIFSDDLEVLAFFQKHTGKDASVVRLKTAYGIYFLLTGSKLGKLPKLYGFTGPEGN